jgi:hypothetical protein
MKTEWTRAELVLQRGFGVEVPRGCRGAVVFDSGVSRSECEGVCW